MILKTSAPLQFRIVMWICGGAEVSVFSVRCMQLPGEYGGLHGQCVCLIYSVIELHRFY